MFLACHLTISGKLNGNPEIRSRINIFLTEEELHEITFDSE